VAEEPKEDPMAAKTTRLFHTTQLVDDLEKTRDWYERVFGRPGFRWEDSLDVSTLDPNYPINYSFFAFIADFPHHFLCPSMHATGNLAGQTRFVGVAEGMIGMGWYSDDAVSMIAQLAALGFRSHKQDGSLITPDNHPYSSFSKNVVVGFTMPEDAGARYEIASPIKKTGLRAAEVDPRLQPDWAGPKHDPKDPLHLLRSSHHTFITNDLDRALRVHVAGLGGRVIHEAWNTELEARSTFVALADAVIEFAVPEVSSPYLKRVQGGLDLQYSITLVSADLDAVNTHTNREGCSPRVAPTGEIVIDAANAYGLEWRFADGTPYPTAPLTATG
jgi:catechol 2,3-dioxygenase-like lactoylglutathione lyase family enzyme